LKYRSYVNVRYGYSVLYPPALLKALPEPDAGDGRTFEAVKGSARIVVYAGFSLPDLPETPQSIAFDAELECPNHTASYRVLKRRLVAVSCRIGNDILYQETLLTADTRTTLVARYPNSERSIWDSVVSKMASSMTAARPAG
jgi:hypothetical protein